MSTTTVPVVLGLLISYCGVLPLAAQQEVVLNFPPSYSCELLGTKDAVSVTYRIYVGGGKIRCELEQAGKKTALLISPKEEAFYKVDFDGKKTFKIPYNTKIFKRFLDSTSAPTGKAEFAGKDVFADVSCAKYKITDDTGKFSWWWVSDSTKLPVKAIKPDGLVVTWTNYKIGPQDPYLFQPPADFPLIDDTPPPSGTGMHN